MKFPHAQVFVITICCCFFKAFQSRRYRFCISFIICYNRAHYFACTLLVRSIYCFVDIDECLTDNGGCNQTCTNTEGLFECSCGTGYILATDNLNCDGKITF